MNQQYKNAPAFTRNRGANQNNFNTSIAPLENLLNRLENVKPSGKGYRADCSNGHRSRGSLSIKETDDGTVLLHCFSGCSALEVAHGLGLELKDLYDRPTGTNPVFAKRSPAEVKAWYWKAAFKYLPEELRVVWIGSQDVREGRPLNDADQARFELACERLRTAMVTLR